MAITTIGDIITGNIPVLLSYMTQDPVERTAFFQSGILAQSPYAAEIARGVNDVTKVVRLFEVITEDELAAMTPKSAPVTDDKASGG